MVTHACNTWEGGAAGEGVQGSLPCTASTVAAEATRDSHKDKQQIRTLFCCKPQCLSFAKILQ